MSEEIINKRKQKFIKEMTKISFIVISLLIFRSSFFEPYRIPSGSMIPTLRIGDFILVNKFAYGFKLPFSDIAMFDFNLSPIYLFGKTNVERGDVVVFKYPNDPSINYIKRVVGVPGDEIEIIDKVVYVNDKKVEIEEIDGTALMKDMDQKYRGNNLKFYKTTVGSHSFTIQQDQDNIYTSQHDKIKVPEGKYFVLGDNRDYSSDSRFWGLVPHEYVRGKAIMTWFSMTMPGAEDQIKVRTERIFKSID